MNDLSEHCLCDHCSGQDCNVFTEEEKERAQKEHDEHIASEALEKFAEWTRSPVVQRQLALYREVLQQQEKQP